MGCFFFLLKEFGFQIQGEGDKLVGKIYVDIDWYFEWYLVDVF